MTDCETEIVIYETGMEEPDAVNDHSAYKNTFFTRSLDEALAAYEDSERNYLIRYTYPANPLQLRKVEHWDSAVQDFVG